MEFNKSVVKANVLLTKGQLISTGKSMSEAGIDAKWMVAYGKIAERTNRDRRFGLIRYPYEAGPSIAAFVGGFFDNRNWGPRKGLERQTSMRAVSEYEAKYINTAGYLGAFHQSAVDMRQEAIGESNNEDARQFYFLQIIAVLYALRVIGLRTEFYCLAAEDPGHAKMVFPALERRGEIASSDVLDATIAQLESHMTTQLMKAVATLHASNATKRPRGRGGPANDNYLNRWDALFGIMCNRMSKHGV